MIGFEIADLAAVVARYLEVDVHEALRLIDVEVAQSVIANVRARRQPHAKAASLLFGLIRGRACARENESVAMLATLQFLNLNGLDLDLVPADGDVVRAIATESVDVAQVTIWLADRLRFAPAERGAEALEDNVSDFVARRGFTTFAERFGKMHAEVSKGFHGRSDVVRLVLTALLADGHILWDNVPGQGATALFRSVSNACGLDSHSISGERDLLPADITGAPVLDRASGVFEFRPGPIFTNMLQVQALHRMAPPTRAALLDALMNRAVTVDGVSHELPRPFLFMGMQNPMDGPDIGLEHLDRFLLRIVAPALDPATEAQLLLGELDTGVQQVVGRAEVLEMQELARTVEVPPSLAQYIVALIHGSSPEVAGGGPVAESVLWGASSRAGLSLLRTARVLAAADGRSQVEARDVQELVRPALGHRLALTVQALSRGETVDTVIDRLLATVRPPAA